MIGSKFLGLNMLKVNTEILFKLLLKYLEPKTVCDIGTMDASHSLIFRKILPKSKIYAFEANPNNAEAIRKNKRVMDAGIQLNELAISDKEGEITFNIQNDNVETGSWQKGASSILKRKEDESGNDIRVKTIRLDNILDPASDKEIFLWVDVEGAAYEVLSGVSNILENILLVHVEVETQEIWKGQHVRKDVDKIMESYGFTGIARGKFDIQHDVVYVKNELLEKRKILMKNILMLSKILTYVRKWGGHILGDLVLFLFIPELLRKPVLK